MSNTNLPWISSNIPPDLRQFLERVRETLSGNEYVRRTDYLSGTVPRNPTDPPGPPEPPVPPKPPCGDPVTPTTPTGLQVSAGFEGFLLSWDMPGYCGHSHTEVYGLRRDGTSADLGVQNMLGESKGVLYSHVVNKPQDYWCFWIKHVNTLDEEGPFTGAGVCAKTALDPGAVIDVLKGQITETELYASLGDKIKLIDVTQPLSTLTNVASLSGRVFYATEPPTNVTADPDLAAGDLWVDTNDYVGTPPSGYYKTYRYTGSTWTLVADGANQLSYAVYNETLVRADADSIEASKREGLFAGAFAGIDNAFRYFIQATDPTTNVPPVDPALRIGDIWAWRDPATDPLAIFKRWCGSFWRVVSPKTDNPNVDVNRRAARFLGASTAGTLPDGPPTAPAAPTGGYVIGDQFLWTMGSPARGATPATNNYWNRIYFYNNIAAPGWVRLENENSTAMASAMVYSEQTVRIDEDSNVLAQATQLVYASAGDSRANITPNACFSNGDVGYTGSVTDFAVVSGNFGRAYIKTGATYTESGSLIGLPVFPVVSGRVYSFTTNARILIPSNGTGSCRLGIQFFASTDGTGAILASNLTAYVTADPAQGGMDFDTTYVVAGATVSQRQKFALTALPAPSTAKSARLVFQWNASLATNIGFTRPQVVVGELPLPTFNCDAMAGDLDATSALVADVATARIGYCTQGNLANGAGTVTTIPTDAVTKQICEALVPSGTGTPQNTWHVGIPFASAVKQVAVDGKAYCIKNGKATADATSDACIANGGVWTDPGSVAIQQSFEALQKSTGELYAQYSVKIDQNGFVSGFGLSSTTTLDGSPYSEFMVRADRFSISSPQIPGIAVTALTKAGTVATLTTTSAHGLAGTALFSLQNITNDARWSKVWRVATVVSTTRITFTVPAELLTPDLTAMPTLVKVVMPFIVTTTDTYDYGPAVVTLTSAMLATMSTAYPLRISILDDTTTVGNYATCPVPASGVDLTASALMDSINNTAGTKALVAATLGSAAGSVVISTNTAGNFTLKVQYTTVAFSSVPCPTKGTVIPAGVYIADAYIKNATINWAQINRATIDWLDVTRQLKAEHILAGSINVDDCIGSSNYVAGNTGWRICGTGNAEFGQVEVRGTIRSTNATGIDTGAGYYMNQGGGLRVGNPQTTAPYLPGLKWDQGQGSLNITGTMRSTTWDGALTNGVISSAGTRGWVIDQAGNAEFETVHLRSNSVSQSNFVSLTESFALTCPPGWSSGTTYVVGNQVFYIVGNIGYVYTCKLSTNIQPPTNTTYWTRSDNYTTVASVTVGSSVPVGTGSGGGLLFFGRASTYALSPTAPAAMLVGPIGDLSVQLLRVSTGFVVGRMGYTLAYRGRWPDALGGLGEYYFGLPITVFERSLYIEGEYQLQMRSNVSGMNININSISLGYMALKR